MRIPDDQYGDMHCQINCYKKLHIVKLVEVMMTHDIDFMDEIF